MKTAIREVKSDLQKKLEKEGWTFVTNMNTGESFSSINPERLIVDLEAAKELRNYLKALKKAYKEVREEQAYDKNGCHIQQMTAIYAIRKK